jgi:hypothetical protein
VGHVQHIPRTTHCESLEHQRQADALVLLQSDAPAQVPAKLYEYLGWNKPVLALLSNATATYDVARASGLCLIADAGRSSDIRAALVRLAGPGGLDLTPDHHYLCQFAEPAPTRRLASCLAEVMSTPAERG